MEITQKDIISFLEAWLTHKEIEQLVESENEFEKNWITYSHEEVKQISRKKLFSKENVYA